MGEAPMRIVLSAGVLALSLTAAAARAEPDWQRVEQTLGYEGQKAGRSGVG